MFQVPTEAKIGVVEMAKIFRVAIIGCGSIAGMHVACLKEQATATIVATVDTKIERASALAKEFDAKAYTDYRLMLAEVKPDVVHICTPHYLHGEMTLEAAKAGANVFLEKPPVMNREQWSLLLEADRLTTVGICFQNRYNQNVTTTLRRLMAEEFGLVLGARANVHWHRSPEYYADDWHGTWALEGGGVLINQAIHTLDLLNLLVGKPLLSVDAKMSNRSLEGIIEVEDTVDAYIRYEGATAMFYATNAYTTNAPVYIELDCEHAKIILNGTDLEIHWKGRDVEFIYDTNLLETGFQDYWGKGHQLCIDDFYEALKKDKPAPITVEDVASTMNLMFHIYEACGRPAVAEQLSVEAEV